MGANPYYFRYRDEHTVSAWEWAWLKETVTGVCCVQLNTTHKRYREIVTDTAWYQLTLTCKRYDELVKTLETSWGWWVKKTCSYCNQEYLAYRTGAMHRLYCSPYCNMSARREREKARLELTRQKTCAYCEVPFNAKRSDAIFCSGKCRVAAHRNKEASQ